eukprot:1159625-Pelagomonas_calceolata.AAC.9
MHALQAPNICHQIRLASSARPITRPSLCASKLPLTPKHHLHVHTAAALAGASPQVSRTPTCLPSCLIKPSSTLWVC